MASSDVGACTTVDVYKRQGEELTEDEREDLDEAAELESISRMPARVKCAELGWRTLSEMIGD